MGLRKTGIEQWTTQKRYEMKMSVYGGLKKCSWHAPLWKREAWEARADRWRRWTSVRTTKSCWSREKPRVLGGDVKEKQLSSILHPLRNSRSHQTLLEAMETEWFPSTVLHWASRTRSLWPQTNQLQYVGTPRSMRELAEALCPVTNTPGGKLWESAVICQDFNSWGRASLL